MHWISGLVQLDLGNSYSYGTPVIELIAERMALTLPLALMAMAITTVVALAAGIYAASRHNKIGDVSVMGLAQLGIAIPNFWFAILLILLFSVHLKWFSAGGFPGWTEAAGGSPWAALKSLMLPALSLAVVQAAILARITRSSVLEVLREDFVRTARAKGLGESVVLVKHVLRNALVPVVTVLGLTLALMIGGTVVTETVFNLPGVGNLVVRAVLRRDYPVIQGTLLVIAAIYVFINLAIDLLYTVVDPRIRLEGK